MIIYKLQQQKTNKVYVGYSVNDNPNNFGTGKYIKRAVKDFGTKAFKREVLEEFDHEDAHKMVTNLTCPECGTFHLVYTPKTFFDKEKYNERT